MDPVATALSKDELDRIQKNQQRARQLRQEKITKQSQQETKEKEESRIQNKGGGRGENVVLHDKDMKKKEAEEEEILEDFEIGASEYITKEQASKLYCLPVASIELCSFIVKENPKCPKFAAMKLYARKEIRKRARDRFGSMEGLQEERRSREQKRLKKDMEGVENIFESK
jgi:DNA-repair protein complementing XP-A cells